MSNILAPWVRPWGALPLNIGVGPIIGGIKGQHLWFDDDGRIYAAEDEEIDHYGAAMPFDVNGRLVVGSGDVYRWDQDIPFTFGGAVAVREPVVAYWDQGLSFLDTGHIASGDVAPPPGEPIWGFIPPKTNFQYELPDTYDVSVYVSDAGSPITSYELINPPGPTGTELVVGNGNNNWGYEQGVMGSINNNEWEGTATEIYEIKVHNDNYAVNFDSDPFGDRWLDLDDLEIVFPGYTVAVSWNGVWYAGVDQGFRDYLAANSGATLAFTVGEPAPQLREVLVATSGANLRGFNRGSGYGALIGEQDWLGTPGATLDVFEAHTSFDELRFNCQTAADDWAGLTNFTVDIEGFATTLNMAGSGAFYESQEVPGLAAYLNANIGNQLEWSWAPPSLSYFAASWFTIDANGVITCAGGTPVDGYLITVRATNAVGSSDQTFVWNVILGNVPTWATIPDISTREELLPADYDVSPYVSSDSGPILSYDLTGPPPGFTIDSGTGVITAADGLAPGPYVISVTATNGVGESLIEQFNWVILDELLPPVWVTIPDRSDEEQTLPQQYDVSSYASSNAGPLRLWSLVSPPTGFSIDSSGVVTAAAGIAVGAYDITVRVWNDVGSSDSAPFEWEIEEEPLPPQWSTIPNREDYEDTLPQLYDVSPYVTSNAGPLTNWTLQIPIPGITIDGSGVITAAAGTAVDNHLVVVRVENNVGGSTANFTWTILEELQPPSWITIPDVSVPFEDLPYNYDVSIYASSNGGQPLFGWQLVPSAPAGFTINGSTGVITAAPDAPVGDTALTVRVVNSTGFTDSAPFTFTVEEELLVPQWTQMPSILIDVSQLPYSFDTKPYVTSNAGALRDWNVGGIMDGFVPIPDDWMIIDENGIVTMTALADDRSYIAGVGVANDVGRGSSPEWVWDISSAGLKSFYLDFTDASGGMLTTKGLPLERNSESRAFGIDRVQRTNPIDEGGWQQGGYPQWTDTGAVRGLVLETRVDNLVRDTDFSDYTPLGDLTVLTGYEDIWGGNEAVLLNDASSSTLGAYRLILTTDQAINRCHSIYVKKSDLRNPPNVLAIEFGAGTASTVVLMDTVSGDIAPGYSSDGEFGVYDEGDWWRLWQYIPAGSLDTAQIYISPAYSYDLSDSGGDLSAQGYNIFCFPQVEQAATRPSTFIRSVGGITQRDQQFLEGPMSGIDGSTIVPTFAPDGNCGQIIFVLAQDWDEWPSQGNSPALFSMTPAGVSSSEQYQYIRMASNGQLQWQHSSELNGGNNRATISLQDMIDITGGKRGDVVDLRWFNDGTTMDLWLNGTWFVDPNVTNGWINTQIADIRFGRSNNSATPRASCEIVRVQWFDGVVPKVEMEAWESWPPQAQQTIDLLPTLTAQEEAAVRRFVTRCYTAGNWHYMDEFWLFAISDPNTAETSWKSGTKGDITGNMIHNPGRGFRITASSTTGRFESGTFLTNRENYDTNDAFMGGYVHEYVYGGNSNDSRWGVQDSGVGARLFSSSNFLFASMLLNHNGQVNNGITKSEWGLGFWGLRRGTQNLDPSQTQSKPVIGKRYLPVTTNNSTRIPTTELWIGQTNNDGASANSCRPQTLMDFVVGSGEIDYKRYYDDLMLLHEDMGIVVTAVQDVLDRFSNLSATEEAAIKKFVLGQIAYFNWQNMDEFYCFALNSTDWLTGFKSHTATVSGVNLVRTSNGAQWQAGSGDSYIDTDYILNNLEFFDDDGGAVGSYIQDYAYSGTSVSYPFAVEDGSSSTRLVLPGSGGAETQFRFNSSGTTFVNSSPQVQIGKQLWSLNGSGGNTAHAWEYGKQLTSASGNQGQGAAENFAMYLGRRNFGNTPASTAREHTQSCHYVGGSRINIITLSSGIFTLLTELGVATI